MSIKMGQQPYVATVSYWLYFLLHKENIIFMVSNRTICIVKEELHQFMLYLRSEIYILQALLQTYTKHVKRVL